MATNTLILISDEHNPLYSAPYGHPTVRTPNMLRMAEEGTLYRNAYCPSPLCLPSRTAFLSGLRVHQVQAYNNCNLCLDESPPTYGDALVRQGIHAVFMGKIDVHKPGAAMGFSETALLHDRRPPGDVNFLRRPLAVRTGAHRRADGFGVRDGAHGEDSRVVDAAVRWIGRTAPRLEVPWVLTVNLTAPHFPHVTTRELWDLYPGGGDLPAIGREHPFAEHPYARDLRDHFETDLFTEDQVRGLRRGYLSCVTFVDRRLGRLLDTLEGAGLRKATNVIYASDHGEMLGKFGMWWKCSLYEDSVRVPVLAVGPDFRRGVEVRTPVDLHDVRAAAFAAAGVPQPDGWQGTALQELADRDDERVVFSEYHGHGVRAAGYMIRRGRWKLLHNLEAPDQLFDLDADPQELEDRSAARPEVAAELAAELRKICDPAAENERAFVFQARQAEEVARRYPDAATGE